MQPLGPWRAAASLLGSGGWVAAARQLLPAAGGALLPGARTLTAAAQPQPDDHHGGDGSDDVEEFRDSVRTFARDFVAPHAAAIDALNAYPPGFEFWRTAGDWGLHGEAQAAAAAAQARPVCLTPDVCDLQPACARASRTRPACTRDQRPTRPPPARGPAPAGITAPAEQGGLGLGYLHHCIAMEELSRASGSGVQRRAPRCAAAALAAGLASGGGSQPVERRRAGSPPPPRAGPCPNPQSLLQLRCRMARTATCASASWCVTPPRSSSLASCPSCSQVGLPGGDCPLPPLFAAVQQALQHTCVQAASAAGVPARLCGPTPAPTLCCRGARGRAGHERAQRRLRRGQHAVPRRWEAGWGRGGGRAGQARRMVALHRALPRSGQIRRSPAPPGLPQTRWTEATCSTAARCGSPTAPSPVRLRGLRRAAARGGAAPQRRQRAPAVATLP